MKNPTGAWRCPKCGFVLMKRVLYTESGNLGVDQKPVTEPCPNDGETMRPVPPDDMEIKP